MWFNIKYYLNSLLNSYKDVKLIEISKKKEKKEKSKYI